MRQGTPQMISGLSGFLRRTRRKIGLKPKAHLLATLQRTDSINKMCHYILKHPYWDKVIHIKKLRISIAKQEIPK